MQGGRAGMVSTVQSMLVVLGRSGLNRCGIPSPSDGEAPELPGGRANPLEAPQFVEDEFAGFWSRECSGEEAWAGLDDPALLRSTPPALLEWGSAGSHSQCSPSAWPPGHSCQPSDTSNIQPSTASLQLPLMFLARKEHPQTGQA